MTVQYLELGLQYISKLSKYHECAYHSGMNLILCYKVNACTENVMPYFPGTNVKNQHNLTVKNKLILRCD